MRTGLLLFLAILLVVGLTAATYILGNVTSALGLAFLAMMVIIGLVIAAAGNNATFPDESP